MCGRKSFALKNVMMISWHDEEKDLKFIFDGELKIDVIIVWS